MYVLHHGTCTPLHSECQTNVLLYGVTKQEQRQSFSKIYTPQRTSGDLADVGSMTVARVRLPAAVLVRELHAVVCLAIRRLTVLPVHELHRRAVDPREAVVVRRARQPDPVVGVTVAEGTTTLPAFHMYPAIAAAKYVFV